MDDDCAVLLSLTETVVVCDNGAIGTALRVKVLVLAEAVTVYGSSPISFEDDDDMIF